MNLKRVNGISYNIVEERQLSHLQAADVYEAMLTRKWLDF
jgi:hypothetical protein